MESENREFGECYHKAHRITEELLEAYSKNLEVKELEETSKFFRENPFSDELIGRLSSSPINRELYDKLDKEDKEANLSLLLERIRIEERRKKSRLVWYRIAASVAAVIAIILVILPEFGKQVQQFANKDGQEQYACPVLIFENDSSLVLTDNGETFVYEEYGLEKTDGNHLRYTANRQHKGNGYNKLIIPSKYIFTLSCSDGTEIMLNAGSSLKYPVDFRGDIREVELTGEAFFKVAKSDKPFIVRMGDSRVKVYGTQFNVHARENSDFEIVLVEGCVGFTPGTGQEVKMLPGQLISYCQHSKQTKVYQVNPEDYVSWTQNMFVFKSRSLNRILDEFSVWYGINITCGRNLENIKLTLIMNKDSSLEEIFRFITEITGIKIIKTGDMEYRTE